MKSQIHLIRHGITEGNLRRLYYGAADIPLAEEGRKALEALAEQSIYPQAEECDFYTSGMVRAEQTLAILYGEVPHSPIEELKEMSFGDFEMKGPEELKELPEFVKWSADKTGELASPGGESIAGFTRRIKGGLKILIGKHRLRELSVRHSGKDAVSTVVCHGGTIASIMEQTFTGQREHFYQWIPDPGHGYTLNMEKGEITGYETF